MIDVIAIEALLVVGLVAAAAGLLTLDRRRARRSAGGTPDAGPADPGVAAA